MAWNQSDGDKGAKRRSGPAVTAAPWWRRLKQQWAAGRGARGPLLSAVAGVVALLWLMSGWYRIDDGQRAVLERFGAYAGERTAGLGWHLPWPIETLTRVNPGLLRSEGFQSRMLSADLALLNITGSVQYQWRDVRQALYGSRDLDKLVHDTGEAATRELIATRSMADTLDGKARTALFEPLRAAVQAQLDALGVGVQVQSLNLTDVQVPEQVLASQRQIEQAQLERDRQAREAQGYAGDLLPRAQEVAQRLRFDAESYKLTAIATAEGDAARFEPLLAAYERAPEVTRNRLYAETMETILARSHKLIIDGKGGGNNFTIPLEKMLDATTTQGTGIAGVAQSSVPTPTPAATPAAAVTSAAPTALTPAVPVATPRDDRSRERPER
jgi:modulator of FtsH protease HflK